MRKPVKDHIAAALFAFALKAALVGIHFISPWQLLQRIKVLLKVWIEVVSTGPGLFNVTAYAPVVSLDE